MDFHRWLQQQRDRTDAVGELACILLDDPISPLWSNRLSTYSTFLVYRNQSGELNQALESAFAEWRRDKAMAFLKEPKDNQP